MICRALAIISCFAASLAIADSNEEALIKTLRKLKDPNSISLNSANYKHYLSNTTKAWLLLFYDSRSLSSLKTFKIWVNFTTNPDTWDGRFGVIDAAYEKILPIRFGVQIIPSGIFIHEGYMYWILALHTADNLNNIVLEKTYMQYDRQALILGKFEESFLKVGLKNYLRLFKESSLKSILILFGLSFASLNFIKFLVRRKKKFKLV